MDDSIDTGVGTGDFEASTQGQWGPQGIEAAGGPAMLDENGHQRLNLDRFRVDPTTELEVSWWNKKVGWHVRREPTAHEVVVARVTENIWRVHLMVAGGAIALGVVGLVLLGGLSPLWGLLLGVLLGAAAYGALRIEQRNGESRVGVEEFYVLDSVLWNGACKKARTDILTKTKSGQKALYDEAVKYYRERYEATYGDPDTGKVGKTWFNTTTSRIEAVPKFEVSDELKANLTSEAGRLGPEAAVDQIGMLLAPSSQARARESLRRAYDKNPVRAENKGRGVSGCGCTACEVNAARGFTPPLFGAEAAHRVQTQRAREAAERARRTGEEVADTGSMRAVMLDVAGKLRGGKQEPDRVYDGASGALVAPKTLKARSELSAAENARAQAADKKRVDDEALAAQTESATAGKEAKARVKAERSQARAAANSSSDKKLPWLLGGGVGLVIIALVAMIVFNAMGKNTESDKTFQRPGAPTSASETTESSVAPTTTPTEEKPPVPPGEVVNVPLTFGPKDPGNQSGGAGAIAAYEYNYYVTRDAVAAQQLYAPGAQGDLLPLRNAIAANPDKTTYEVVVTPTVPGSQYQVRLTVMWPQGKTSVDQKFFTTYIDGKFFILRSE